MSNIYKREKFRHSSYVSMAADSVISGFGIDGYIFALESIIKTIENKYGVKLDGIYDGPVSNTGEKFIQLKN